jgi:hypothetical protein
MNKAHALALVLAAIALAPCGAVAADSYPVSGRWTYENAEAAGPAADCGKRKMEFRGAQRLDTGGGVPEYRNVSVSRISATSYQVVDEFFNVQIRGHTEFSLRLIDQDHIELHLDRAGKTVTLRRCA